MKKKLQYLSFVFLFLLTLSGCEEATQNDLAPDSPEGKEFYVSATPAGSFTKAELQAFATLRGFGNYLPLISYDVDYFKLTYKTIFKGDTILASGLIGIPKNVPVPSALLSAQHGTMFSDAEAPSNFPLAFTGFELFASTGLVTVIPDYIGFGVSKDIVHPYYDMQSSGLAVVNMIRAAKYFLTTQNKTISDKLFLLGYSEGGYVTMAAQKEIETNSSHNLTLTAVAAGAGGYDLGGMLSKIATVPSYSDPSFLALIIHAYNTTYGWKRPLTDFFVEPYASKIPGLLDGSKNGDQINAQLNTSPALLFCSTFYKDLKSPSGEQTLKAKLAENSFPGWYPKSPTRLYHGTADESVFFETSQSTYLRFLTAGASKLEFLPIPGGTHQTSIQPMMLNALPWIQSLSL